MKYRPGGSQYILMAQYALALLNWRWFPGCEAVCKRDQQLLIPPLLFGAYLATRAARKSRRPKHATSWAWTGQRPVPSSSVRSKPMA
jgi:hypothetical protein